MVRIRVIQNAPRLGRLQENLEAHGREIAQAAREGVNLLVFPELSLTGYLLKDLVSEVALSTEGLLTKIEGATQGVQDIEALVGFAEETAGHHFHNSAAFLRWDSNGHVELVHVHRKIYLPTYGLFDEGRYYSRGRTIRVFESRWLGRTGILICEDAWHLSLPLLLAVDGPALEGVGAILIPSNSPARGVSVSAQGIPESYRIWEDLIRTYSTLLGVAVIYANRAGVEDGLTFSGGSQVTAPGGGLLGRAGFFDPENLEVDLDWPEALRSHRIGSPILAADDLDLLRRELDRIFHRRMED